MHTIASDAGRQIFEAPLYSAGIALYRFGVRIAGLHNEKAKKLDEGQRHIKDHLAEHPA